MLALKLTVFFYLSLFLLNAYFIICRHRTLPKAVCSRFYKYLCTLNKIKENKQARALLGHNERKARDNFQKAPMSTAFFLSRLYRQRIFKTIFLVLFSFLSLPLSFFLGLPFTEGYK